MAGQTFTIRVPMSDPHPETREAINKRTEEWSVEVTADLQKIALDLGAKAVRNKSGISRDGHVTVKRIRKLGSEPR